MKYSVFVALALALATNARPFGGHHHGGFGGGNNGGNNGGNGAAAASSSAAAVLTSAAAASTTTAAAVDSASTSATATSSVAIPSFSDTATANNPDVQNSLTLDPSVIATGFLNNGQSVQEAGQVASLTSGNNFINFCATRPDLQITNGLQITDGSCNPAPMGLIPSTANMPSAKFTFPTNGGNVAANTPFTISLAIQGMQTGFFVNAEQNYFAAPQQLNAGGQVIGHSHVVVETLSSLTQDTPTDPTKFAFFKGLNAAAVNGILTANVTAGLPAGTYKVSTINTAANHQPILVPIAQHGSLDDVVYFTVSGGDAAAANSTDNAAAASTSVAAAAAASTTAAAASTSVAAASTAAAAAVSSSAATVSFAPAAAVSSAAASAAPSAPAVAAGGQGGQGGFGFGGGHHHH
jgi:hypothetical protein